MTTQLAPDTLRAVESRAEVDCLGDLQQQRRELLVTFAPLKALHGPFGLFDDKRKQMLEAMKVKARMTLEADPKRAGKKPPEAEIDAAAYADPQYENYLDEAYDAKILYVTQANDLTEIEERIRSREIEIQFATQELRLAR